jgi:hypothetical protein
MNEFISSKEKEKLENKLALLTKKEKSLRYYSNASIVFDTRVYAHHSKLLFQRKLIASIL